MAFFRIDPQRSMPCTGRGTDQLYVGGSCRATFSHGVANLSIVPRQHEGVWGARCDCQEGGHGEVFTAPAGVWVPTAVRLRRLSSAELPEDRSNAHEA